jgi:hypothetical protein
MAGDRKEKARKLTRLKPRPGLRKLGDKAASQVCGGTVRPAPLALTIKGSMVNIN